MKVHEYLEENKEVIKTLINIGFVNLSVLGNIDAYKEYVKTEDMEETKQIRCEFVSEKIKLKPETIEKIVTKMEKPVPF